MGIPVRLKSPNSPTIAVLEIDSFPGRVPRFETHLQPSNRKGTTLLGPQRTVDCPLPHVNGGPGPQSNKFTVVVGFCLWFRIFGFRDGFQGLGLGFVVTLYEGDVVKALSSP